MVIIVEKEVVFETIVNSTGRLTIPKVLRDKLRLEPGDKLLWSFEHGRVILSAKNHSIKELAGMLHRPGLRPATLEEIDKAIAEAASESAMAGFKPRQR